MITVRLLIQKRHADQLADVHDFETYTQPTRLVAQGRCPGYLYVIPEGEYGFLIDGVFKEARDVELRHEFIDYWCDKAQKRMRRFDWEMAGSFVFVSSLLNWR